MEITDGARAAKKHKAHEAEMIPGLSPRIFGFPNSIITKLKYCDFYTMTSATGAVVQQVICANGIYDPDITGVGHQPMYRDTYAGIYDQYTVIGSKITCYFNATSSNGSVICGIHGDDDGTGSTTLTTIMECNNTVWDVLGNSGSGHDSAVHTMTFEPLEAFGVDTKDDGASSTAVGANPTEMWDYHIFVANIVGATSTVNVAIQVEYTVKFSELTTQVQS